MEKEVTGKTWLLVRPNFMAEYIMGALAGNPEYEVVWHEATRGLLNVIKRFLRVRLFRKCRGLWLDSFYSKAYQEKLRAIGPGDRVVIWALGNVKDISLLSAEIASRDINSYLWDPMRKVSHNSIRRSMKYSERMRKLGVRVFTFDREDARRFNLEYAGQVYRRPEETVSANKDDEYDLFFVGVAKDRAPLLEEIAAMADREGIKRRFLVQPNKHKTLDRYPLLRQGEIKEPMAYRDVMREIAASRALLEIMQKAQSGLTLRTLEALFFGKKLVTDNKAVKQEPLYDKNNIYILGDDGQSWPSLKAFLDAPVHDMRDSAILADYEIERWLLRLGDKSQLGNRPE